jgi:photosystem II stability/assembly factor-like uncharacterized protein
MNRSDPAPAASPARCAAAATTASFVDVLAVPATQSALAPRSLMQSVARAGERIVAAGQRGHVVVSVDGGASWKQAKVPVSSDLTSVFFVDALNGWATGHDGVVLATRDGGDTWTLQLDGHKANQLLVAAMERNASASPSAESKALLDEAKRFLDQGPDKPFLDVWFADASNGWVVGAYNLVFRTRDGGGNWEPWFDRTDNPKLFNLYAIRPAAGALFVVGEGGVVLKLDEAARRFRAVATPYAGSFFGVTDARNAVVAFGLRGNVWRSDDAGGTWTKADSGLTAAVVAATQTREGATLLADAGGRVVVTEDGGRTFRPLALRPAMPANALLDAGGGRLVIAGPRGVAAAEAVAR